MLESQFARAHRLIDMGDRSAAERQLANAAPFEAIVLADVAALGVSDQQRVVTTTSALRDAGDAQVTALLLAVVAVIGGLVILARWIAITVASPLRRLLHQAEKLSVHRAAEELPPDSVPHEFRPLAVAMNEAGQTLARVAEAEQLAKELLSAQTETLRELQLRSEELEIEIVARRQAELSAREARHRADAANRAKSDFLGSNGTHLLELIDKVLDLAKVEAGRMTAEIEAVDLGALVRDTVAEMEGRVLTLGGKVELRAEVPARLMTFASDRTKLKQMLINLVGNALKFTERGTVTARVVVDVATRAPIRIEVIDTGPGVPLDRQEAIFEAFERNLATPVRQALR
ncbi:MAG: ATP-binding protein [bacterium]